MMINVLKGKGGGNEEWIENAGELQVLRVASAMRIISREEFKNH